MLDKNHEGRIAKILEEAGLGDESHMLAKIFTHIADEFPHQRKFHPKEEDNSNDSVRWVGLTVRSLESGMEGEVGMGLFRKRCLKTATLLIRAIMAVDRKLYSYKGVQYLPDEL